MKRMKQIMGWSLVILIAFLYAHIAKSTIIYDETVMEGSGRHEYITFVCQEQTIDGIQVKARVLEGSDNSELKIKVTEYETEQVLFEQEIALQELESGKYNKISFTKEGCKGKTYKLIFENSECLQEGTVVVKTITEKFDIETFVLFLVLICYIYLFFKFLYRLFAR